MFFASDLVFFTSSPPRKQIEQIQLDHIVEKFDVIPALWLEHNPNPQDVIVEAYFFCGLDYTERKKSHPAAAGLADAIALVYSISDRSTFDCLVDVYHQMCNINNKGRRLPFILVGNHCDDSNEREVSAEQGENLARVLGMLFMEVSSMRNHFVFDEVITSLLRHCPYFTAGHYGLPEYKLHVFCLEERPFSFLFYYSRQTVMFVQGSEDSFRKHYRICGLPFAKSGLDRIG